MNQHRRAPGNRKLNQRPRVFVSYSSEPPENRIWAMRLTEKIRMAGLLVISDDKKPAGKKMSSFVLDYVNDTSFTHILIICTKSYAAMAERAANGEETESPVIPGKLFEVNENKRFLNIVRERDDLGRPFIPEYLSERPSLSFINDITFDENCKSLIARIKLNNETGTMNSTLAFGEASHAGRRWLHELTPVRMVVAAILLIALVIGIRSYRMAKVIDKELAYQNAKNKKPDPVMKYRGIWVVNDDKLILTDLNGKIIPGASFDEVNDFYQDRAKVQRKGKWGYINRAGLEIVPCIYDELSLFFSNGKACVNQGDKWGFVNIDGTLMGPLVYEECSTFTEGLAAVKKDGHWGYINEHNKIVIPCIYDKAGDFEQGKAAVSKAGKSYVIDNKGRRV